MYVVCRLVDRWKRGPGEKRKIQHLRGEIHHDSFVFDVLSRPLPEDAVLRLMGSVRRGEYVEPKDVELTANNDELNGRIGNCIIYDRIK